MLPSGLFTSSHAILQPLSRLRCSPSSFEMYDHQRWWCRGLLAQRFCITCLWDTRLQDLVAVLSHHCVTYVNLIGCLIVLPYFTCSRVLQVWVGGTEGLRNVTIPPEDAQKLAQAEEQGGGGGDDVKVCLCVAKCKCCEMTSPHFSYLYFSFLARGNFCKDERVGSREYR